MGKVPPEIVASGLTVQRRIRSPLRHSPGGLPRPHFIPRDLRLRHHHRRRPGSEAHASFFEVGQSPSPPTPSLWGGVDPPETSLPSELPPTRAIPPSHMWHGGIAGRPDRDSFPTCTCVSLPPECPILLLCPAHRSTSLVRGSGRFKSAGVRRNHARRFVPPGAHPLPRGSIWVIPSTLPHATDRSHSDEDPMIPDYH